MTQFQYRIRCPECAFALLLLETTLAEIVQGRKMLTTGAPFVTLVCQECKLAFQFDYPKRQSLGCSYELHQSGGPRFSLVAECGDNNCKSPVELVALRGPGTTEEQCYEEIAAWDVSRIRCRNGHQIIIPEPPYKKH